MADERFDVIVVGARCAGSSLAIRLARAGMRVCVLDRARFPSDTPSTHAIQPSGVAILRELGMFESLTRTTVPLERGTIVLDDARIEVDGCSERLGAPMLCIRRITLDGALLAAAAAAGAEIRTRTPVTGLLADGGRVTGVTTATTTLCAPLVVGADGARSTVARLTGIGEYAVTRPGRLFLWAYFEGAPTEGRLWLAKINDYGFLAAPTDGGLFMTAVVPSMTRRDEVLADPAAAYAAGLNEWPELEAALSPARRVGPIRAMPRWHGFFRPAAGPGWALVGDAGHFKDPTPGQGISDALRQASTLADVVVAGLGGARSLDQGLRDWWSWRDRDAWEMYWFARDLGAAGPTPPLTRAIQRRIAAEPALVDGLLAVLNHDVVPSQVFTAPLALAALTDTVRTRAGTRAVLAEAASLAVDTLRHRRPPRLPAANGALPTR